MNMRRRVENYPGQLFPNNEYILVKNLNMFTLYKSCPSVDGTDIRSNIEIK